jgi:hypothetical protein
MKSLMFAMVAVCATAMCATALAQPIPVQFGQPYGGFGPHVAPPVVIGPVYRHGQLVPVRPPVIHQQYGGTLPLTQHPARGYRNAERAPVDYRDQLGGPIDDATFDAQDENGSPLPEDDQSGLGIGSGPGSPPLGGMPLGGGLLGGPSGGLTPGTKIEGQGILSGQPYSVEVTERNGQIGYLFRWKGAFLGNDYTLFVPKRN